MNNSSRSFQSQHTKVVILVGFSDGNPSLFSGKDRPHVGVDNYLEHHFRMIRATPRSLIKLLETVKIEIIYNSIDNAHWVVHNYVFIDSLWKKNGLVGNVGTKI